MKALIMISLILNGILILFAWLQYKNNGERNLREKALEDEKDRAYYRREKSAKVFKIH